MTYITELQSAIASVIHAGEVTEGDIILHLGSCIQLISERQHIKRGIMFNALWLDYGAYRGKFDSPHACIDSQVPVFDTRLAA